MLKKMWAGISLVLVLLAAAACGGDSQEASESKPKGDASSAPGKGAEGPGGKQSGLADIPKVVATVNGQPIPRAEFVDAYTSQLQQSGAQPGQQVDQDALKKQTVDTLVGTELLKQEADRQEIEASNQDVDGRIADLAAQNGMKSPDQLVAALKKQGLSEQQVRSHVRDQVVIEQLVSAEAGDTTATEAEVKQLYEQLVAQQEQAGGGGQVPPLKQVKPQLEQQVESQKESAAAQKLVTKLRRDADITINL